MTLPPIRREVLVNTSPDHAFDVFTTQIGRWWPLATHGVFGGDSTVAMDGHRIVETSTAGVVALWGTVTDWDPPALVAFTWHPGQTEEKASHVAVHFAAAADKTLVVLEHSGWEAYAGPAQAREEYGEGWPLVLAGYRDDVQDEVDDAAPATWVALMHRPGASPPAAGGIFADPRFRHHVAFVQSMRGAGYLVAAGPLDGEEGSGMTVLRLPGDDRFEEAVHLATTTDEAVTSGLLAVTVRPWRVMFRS